MSLVVSTFNSTVFALVYGTPLVRFVGSALPIVTNQSVNHLYSTFEISTPAAPLGPGVDTIYSAGIYDLSQNDLVITVPKIDTDRYFNIAILDPFESTIANLGTVTKTVPGDYFIGLPHEDGEGDVQYGIVPPPKSTPKSKPKYEGKVVSPSTFGRILVRALIKNNGSDLAHVQGLLRQCNLTAVSRPSKRKTVTELFRTFGKNELAILEDLVSIASLKALVLLPPVSLVKTILEVTALLTPENPPWNMSASDSGAVMRLLFIAGISNGLYTPDPGVNLSLAAAEALSEVAHAATVGDVQLNNGWIRNSPQGTYGTNFAERADVSISADNEQTIDQALYPVNHDITLTTVSPSVSYLFTFSSKPPILPTGFWSLTLYLLDQRLYANPLNKYAVGDRSNITYPDGSLAYGGPKSSSTDGRFQILVQSIATPPPANWTDNWIPGPAVATNVTVPLRLYAPTEAMINGKWKYPVVTKIAPIKG